METKKERTSPNYNNLVGQEQSSKLHARVGGLMLHKTRILFELNYKNIILIAWARVEYGKLIISENVS